MNRYIIAAIVAIGLLCTMGWLDKDKDELQAAADHTTECLAAAKVRK
jgi:hypothetical protein